MTTTPFNEVSPDQSADVVIVGAGISGLYTAWRLIEDDPNRKIVIVERLNRIGGRLDSDLIEVKPGQIVREEEGGMRFNYGMTELMTVNRALGLCDQIVPFPMASNVEGFGNTNRFFERGHRFTAEEGSAGIKGIWSMLYDLNDAEQGLSPTDIVTNAYHAVLAQNGAEAPKVQTPEFWTEFREQFTWNDTPLNQWQMWGLLRDMGHSEECVRMLTETIGFIGPFMAPINAGDAFQILADFPVDPSYFTFKKGFSTLPNAVAAQLEGKVEIVVGTNVDTITRQDDDFELTLTEAPDHLSSNPNVTGGVTKKITGDKLILAVATAGMEGLFASSPALNAHADSHRLWENIHSVRGMRLMKINLYFEDAWWKDGTVDPPVEFGPNFTNLPVNAVYPFYSLESENVGLTAEEHAHHQAAALTIYCDFDNTTFWAGLQNVGQKFNSGLQAKQSAKEPQTLFPASQKVVDEAIKQLKSLFAINDVPTPILTSYRLWDGENDFEFAYHQWRLNAVDSEIREYLSEPDGFDGLHFCNEAISDMHGWVNGSIRSANLALAKMGVAPMTGDACVAPPKEPSHPLPARATGLWGA